MENTGLLTFKGVAHPWMCDTMGHMNVRYYASMFDDATFQLLGFISGSSSTAHGLGWADVRSHTQYKREVAPGELISIHSRVKKIGGSSVTFEQIMTSTIDEKLRAINETVSVRFDLSARVAARMSDAERKRAEKLLIDV
ncbi:acyl-CoA thioesterase [Falsochrobactrum ovis]|uniref:(3S)-malyl-CoA thioesterase n=1 Tax=Falsochrobactrum ovis TaxID=1293442 RepID=A0A364JX24_9HYPH|nr:acyl-CoA thioesterase [Falsochrobactrum ovis]RAK31190.1 (3S)-malyl-CoA thioesterase [Falsochrobactrum ovis]